MELLFNQPWPWYVAGPLLGLAIPGLLIFVKKSLGISSSLTHICSMAFPKNKNLSTNNWKGEIWNLFFVLGIVIGGFIGGHFMVRESLSLLPDYYFTFPGLLLLFSGGIFVGFGVRYANGCTSGHTIMGIANLKVPSLIATVFFFLGGLFAAGLKTLFL